MSPKTIILIINLILGAGVIASYIFTLRGNKKGADAFWGGTPAKVKSLYTVSMLLSAVGYFAFIYFTLFRLDFSTINAGWLYVAFIGILGASILWMPLTNIYLTKASPALWLAIRSVLAIVGVASILLAYLFISLHLTETSTAYWLAVAGSSYFAFHTAILDMLFWPVFFKAKR
jgi:hypothetical protein